jgi:spore germination cell wall hydrolase CwlJ-like protein
MRTPGEVMYKHKPLIFGMTLVALLLYGLLPARVHAQEQVLGRKLSAAELAQYANSPSIAVGDESFKVISTQSVTKATSAASTAMTQVINADGVIGTSTNEVIVSQVGVNTVTQAVTQLSVKPAASQYYPHLNLSRLSFASFQDAARAQAQLSAALPQARVDLPIEYSKPTIR